MKSSAILCFILFVLLPAGCTYDNSYPHKEERFLSESEKQTALSKSRPPQFYGFQPFSANDGLGFYGGARLHPNHLTPSDFIHGTMPVIAVKGLSKRMTCRALLDTGSPVSWMEFFTSGKFNVRFLSLNNQVIPYRGGYNTGGAEAYAGVVSQLRIEQLFIENAPFYIRMSTGSLGPLARGIISPQIDAVFGYDLIAQFEYVRFNLKARQVVFSSTIPYAPSLNFLMSTAKIVELPNYGLAVEGAIFGKPTPIILDIAGEYHFARSDVKTSVTRQVSLGKTVYRQVPTLRLPINASPPRAGRKMLEKYIITICPRIGVVYFERANKYYNFSP